MSPTRQTAGRAARHAGGAIAFPSISTGVYGYPIAEAAPVALAAARDFAAANPEAFTEIRFVLFSDQDLAAYRKAAAGLKLAIETE